MIGQEHLKRITDALPILQRADPPLVREFMQKAFLTRIPVGRDVFMEDERVDPIALLLSGVVRVYKIGETGREITLYRPLGVKCKKSSTSNLYFDRVVQPPTGCWRACAWLDRVSRLRLSKF